MSGDARERFAAMAREPDARIDLAEAALLVAAEEYPSLEPAHYLAELDALASRARGELAGAGDAAARVERLNALLFDVEGFRGNLERYDDPRNSFLNDVIDRRTGIPITLSLVYTEVGRRAGVHVRGIGFPGHFLVKCVEEGEIVIDPFHGSVLSLDECQQRLRAALGPAAVLRPEVHLRSATPREILVRLLSNLKIHYARAEDYERALGCCERILLVVPEAPLELRDRGLVFEQLECFQAAVDDLERFLALAPRDASAAAIRDRVGELRLKARQVH